MWATYVSCWAYCVCRSEIRWECAAAHFCCVGGCDFVFWSAGCFFASYWWRLEVYECSCPSHAPPSVTVLLKSLCKETQQYHFTKYVGHPSVQRDYEHLWCMHEWWPGKCMYIGAVLSQGIHSPLSACMCYPRGWMDWPTPLGHMNTTSYILAI